MAKDAFKGCLVSMLFACLCFGVCAMSPSDSIRHSLPSLSNADKLVAYSNLCRMATAENNSKYELKCISDYIAEAQRQGDVEAEGSARSMQVVAYYNYNMDDEISKTLPGHLSFMSRNKLWDYYYNTWDLQVELYICRNKLQTALVEARKMYEDARLRNVNYGLGIASYCIGSIYQVMQRYPQAEQSFDRSIAALRKEEDISRLLSVYNAMCESLDAMHKYDKLRAVALQWHTVIDNYKKKAEAKGYVTSLNGRYLYCVLAQAVAELGSNNPEKCAIYLNKAEEFAKGRKAISQFKLLQVKARYYTLINNYPMAIACNEKNMAIIKDRDDYASLLTVQQQQADLFLKAGRPMDAALLYKHIIPAKDSIRDNELTTQLDELNTIYKVDKLKLEQKIATNHFYMALSCGILFLIVVILVLFYAYRLRLKNKALYGLLNKLEASNNNLSVANTRIPEASLTREEALFRNLCKLMRDDKIFLNQIGRKELADMLGTNTTYLADAIKQFANGSTINDFVNYYRLRYAGRLLTERLDLTINEVGDEAGFASRATYSRLFKLHYSMSPREYRSLAKDEKS